MNPQIISVKQATRLAAGSIPVAVLEVTWTAGPFGPFTLESSWVDLNSGKLLQDLQQKAAQLGALPIATA